jgi:transcriptional regulator GlxA family with amidase domain
MDLTWTVAIVVYQGILADETEAFRFVLSRLPGTHLVTVGARRGSVAGPGGVQLVEATFDEVASPEIVALPGGLGCHRQAEVATWLRTISPVWLLASSTGSALLATAGILQDETAATHWLAGSILESNGAHPSRARVVVQGSHITCAGQVSAYGAALIVARSMGGQHLVERIRRQLSEAVEAQAAARRRQGGTGPGGGRGWWRRRRTIVREPVTRLPSPDLLSDLELTEIDLRARDN